MRTAILFLISILVVVFISAFKAQNGNDIIVSEELCTQKICVSTDTATYIPDVLVEIVDSAGAVVDTCVTSFSGCCNVIVQYGLHYEARVPQFDSAPPVEFTACQPKLVRIIVY